MLSKILGLFLFITVAIQIVFSFYYSSEIINQNNFLQSKQTELNILKNQNHQLEKDFASLNSLNYLFPQIQSLGLTPIQNKINLNKF